MATRAPVEVWTQILEQAIYVPLFFEVDPAETHGVTSLPQYYYELPYWRSERTRNSLRRVCRDWNTFLHTDFDHRFVRLTDIYHERIPTTVIHRAIRLDIEPDWQCFCPKYCKNPKSKKIDFVKDWAKLSMMETLKKVGSIETEGPNKGEWEVKILSGRLTDDAEDLQLIQHKAPKLCSILGWGCTDFTLLNRLSKQLKTIVADRISRTSEGTLNITLHSSVLTTMFLRLDKMALPFVGAFFPQLRHLVIECHFSPQESEFVKLLETLLEAVGRELRSLIVQNTRILAPISEKTWTLAPKLECLQLPCILQKGPPSDHPLSRIMLPVHILCRNGETLSGELNSPIMKLLPPTNEAEWVTGKKLHIMTSDPWQWLLFHCPLTWSKSAIWLAEFYGSAGTKFTDGNGISLNQYIVFLISVYWKGKRGREKFVYRGGRNPPMF